MRSLRLTCVWFLFSLVTAASASGQLAVSPGSPDGVAWTSSRCPTFIWGRVAGAVGYELVVYGLEEGRMAEAPPILRQRFPGEVTAWSPPLALCLTEGRSYAWSIQATLPRGKAVWSEPNLFAIANAPSSQELAEALAVVERYLTSRAAEPETGPASARRLDRPPVRREAWRAPLPASVRAVPFTYDFQHRGLFVDEATGAPDTAAIYGRVTAEPGSGFQAGVFGEVFGGGGTVIDGTPSAIWGLNTSSFGAGVRGEALTDDPTGSSDGVQGFSNAPSGAGGVFNGFNGALALKVSTGDTDLRTLRATAVDLLGATSISLPAFGISGAGPGSGLNADLVDGLHGSDLAPAGHSHSGRHLHTQVVEVSSLPDATTLTADCAARPPARQLTGGGCSCGAPTYLLESKPLETAGEWQWSCTCSARTAISAFAVCSEEWTGTLP